VKHRDSAAMALVPVQQETEYLIKPENVTPTINYGDWPLLLKNWNQREYYSISLMISFTTSPVS